MIPDAPRRVRLDSRIVALLGAALALAMIVAAYLGRDTRTIDEVPQERNHAPTASGAVAPPSPPVSDASATTAPKAGTPAPSAPQSALDRGIAERKARDDAACQNGDAQACANLRAAVRTRQDYGSCAADDADACRRVVNSLRAPDQRQEMHDRCEGGDTRACVLLSNFHLNVEPDAKRVADYQAIALAQLKADPRPERREAALAIEAELAALGTTDGR